jgi:tetratricopeptide (TPR) repeat protein
LKINPNDASLAFQIMLTYNQKRDYSKAEEMIDKALNLVPDNQRNLNQKAWFRFFDHQNLQLLRNELYELRKLYGDRNNWMTNQIVNVLVRDRKFKEALIELDQVTIPFNIGQDFFIPYDYIKGTIFFQMGLKKKANSLFENARKLLEKELIKNPQDIRISSDLALIYAYLNRQEDATSMINVAMDEVPIERDVGDYAGYLNKKAEVNLIFGNYDQVLSILKRSASIFGGIGYFDLLQPKWDPIKNDPEFHALLKKLKPKA